MYHTSSIIDNKILVYGGKFLETYFLFISDFINNLNLGMQNADRTLDTLAVLCLDGQIIELNNKDIIEKLSEQHKLLGDSISENVKTGKFVVITHSVDTLSNRFNSNGLEESKNIFNGTSSLGNGSYHKITKEKSVDTSDLLYDACFDFEELKKNYINNLISWSFLKKLSDYYQWPLSCIMNFVDNSCSPEVKSHNVRVDLLCLDRQIYSLESINSDENRINLDEEKFQIRNNMQSITNKIITLAIRDDGLGMNIKEFNHVLFSFSVNENKEFLFMKYGVTMKSSAMRLGNAMLLISKTDKTLSFGLIAKSLQKKIETDFVLTPVVNCNFNSNSLKGSGDIDEVFFERFLPVSKFHIASLNLIMNEVKFIFKNKEVFYNYCNEIVTGTHIFVYDLKQNSKRSVYQLNNYELTYDEHSNDILCNYIYNIIPSNSLIDCSLKTYMKFFFLKKPSGVNLFVMGDKIDLINPMACVLNTSRDRDDIRIAKSLKFEELSIRQALIIDGRHYKGILFNDEHLNSLIRSNIAGGEYYSKELNNGVLLYRNNKLVSRFDQSKFGDICYLLNKLSEDKDEVIWKVNGFIEIDSCIVNTLPNKSEFKEQIIFAVIYPNVRELIKKFKI